MKTLIVYYSRTDITKKVAESIQKMLNCDVEEIIPKVNYQGKLGYARGIKDAIAEKCVPLETLKYNPDDYDCIIMGVPVWASKSANPLISYIEENKDKLSNVKLFITAGSSGFESTLKQVNKHLSSSVEDSLFIRSIDVKNDNYQDKLDDFIQ